MPILVLLDEGASANVIGSDMAKQLDLLDKIDTTKKSTAILPGGQTIENLGQVKAIFQVENIKISLKVSILQGEQAYMLLSEVDQDRLNITKDRNNKIARINGRVISYQDITPNQSQGLTGLNLNSTAKIGLDFNSAIGTPSHTLKKEESTHVSRDKNSRPPATVTPSHLARKARDTPPLSEKKTNKGAQRGRKTITPTTHLLVSSFTNIHSEAQRECKNN